MSHLWINLGILFCIEMLEWLNAGVSTKITLRPSGFQGLMHLMLSTSSVHDSRPWPTAILFSEIAVLMNYERIVQIEYLNIRPWRPYDKTHGTPPCPCGSDDTEE